MSIRQLHQHNLTLLQLAQPIPSLLRNRSYVDTTRAEAPYLRQRTQTQDDTLSSSLFLFLSIVHGDAQLLKIFKEKAMSKDVFLQTYEKQIYDQLLLWVLQIFNAYYTERCQPPSSQRQKLSELLTNRISQQSQYSSQATEPKCKPAINLHSLRGMISDIIKKDLVPLRRGLNKDQVVKTAPAKNVTERSSIEISPIKATTDKTEYNSMEKLLSRISFGVRITDQSIEEQFGCRKGTAQFPVKMVIEDSSQTVTTELRRGERGSSMRVPSTERPVIKSPNSHSGTVRARSPSYDRASFQTQKEVNSIDLITRKKKVASKTSPRAFDIISNSGHE